MSYLNLKIKQIIRETPDAISIVFDRPMSVNFKAGQFLTFILQIEGKVVRRSYSLCSAPHEKDRLAVTVKRVESGLVSNYLNDKSKVGDEIKVMEPMGSFYAESDSSQQRHFVLFAGGSGITPMMSILKTVLKDEPKSFISLIFANRNEQSIIFKSELDELQTKFAHRFNIIHNLDSGSDSWKGRVGMLNKDSVKRILDSFTLPATVKAQYYVCGPTGMMDTVTEALNEYGIQKQSIFKESFVSAPSTDVAPKEDSSLFKTVKIIYNGKEYSVQVFENESILDAALDDNIDLPYSCQGGVCTACRGKCLSGKVDLSEVEGLSDAEMSQGYVLTCVGHPLTDDVVIQIG